MQALRCALLASLAIASFATADPRVPNDEQAQVDNRFFLTIYSAVWEGLFRDGVQPEVAKWIACGGPPRQDGLQNTFFVYGCDLCRPVSEAFAQYADHTPLVTFKPPHNWTLGPGLSQESIDRLHSDDLNIRLGELGVLVQRWVGDRLAQMNLSPDERARWDAKFERAREHGMKHLKSNIEFAHSRGERSIYEEWTTCPSCEGSNKACKVGKEAKMPISAPVKDAPAVREH